MTLFSQRHEPFVWMRIFPCFCRESYRLTLGIDSNKATRDMEHLGCRFNLVQKKRFFPACFGRPTVMYDIHTTSEYLLLVESSRIHTVYANAAVKSDVISSHFLLKYIVCIGCAS